MNKKPENNLITILLQSLFLASSMIVYRKTRPIVGPISVKIVSGIFRILGFRKFADMLYGSIEYEFGDREVDDDEIDNDEVDDNEIDNDEVDDDEIDNDEVDDDEF